MQRLTEFIKFYFSKVNAFIWVSLLYILIRLVVNFHGEIPINDDWIFVRQVEAFGFGQFAINGLIDPTFILQGLIGFVWATITQFNFDSLRLLTGIVTLLFLLVSYIFLKALDLKKSLVLVFLVLLAFNPLILLSSFTFMTENYYLLFYVLSLYFYFKYFKELSIKNLILGTVFALFALLIRQTAVVLFLASVLTIFIYSRKKTRDVLLVLAFFMVGIAIYSFWPRYLQDGLSIATANTNLPQNFIDPLDIPQRLLVLVYAPFYFIFFTLPIYLKTDNYTKRNKLVMLLGFIALVFSSWHLFEKDVFPIGNVLYMEGILAKSNFREFFSLFDNVVSKQIFSFLICLALVRFIMLYKFARKLDGIATFLLLTFLGSFSILIFGSDMYDRYLLPAFISFIFFLIYYFKDQLTFSTILQYVVLIGYILFSVFLVSEYLVHTRIRWEQAYQIQEQTGTIRGIFVEGTYSKYFAAIKENNFTGDVRAGLPSKYDCYVQKYTVDNGGYAKALITINDFIKSYIDNPEIKDAKRNTALPNIKKHLDELMFNQKYISPIFNLLGKDAYVGSWCEK